MELWIRSQDRKCLIKANILEYEIDANNKVIIKGCTDTEGWFHTLGKYKNKTRALEILDEIQERLINLQLVSLEEKGKARKDVYTTPYLECVYRMPEE